MSQPAVPASSIGFSASEHPFPISHLPTARRLAAPSIPLTFLSAFGAAWGYFIAAFGWPGVLLGWWPAALIGGGTLAVLQGIELARSPASILIRRRGAAEPGPVLIGNAVEHD